MSMPSLFYFNSCCRVGNYRYISVLIKVGFKGLGFAGRHE